MTKKAVGIVFVIFLTVMLTAIPVYARRQSVCPPTSLEVWKVITEVVRDGDEVTVYGTIFILNDVENWAWVETIKDSVEAKGRGPGWTQLNEIVVAHRDPEYILEPGELASVEFEITFTTGDYKAYRNVVEVLLDNHPTGNRWFHYRLSFEVPEVST